MAAAVHLTLLLSLCYGSSDLVTARPPDDHTDAVRSTAAAFTTTLSLFSAGTTGNATDAPSTESTTSYSETTSKPLSSSTTTEHVTEQSGKTAGNRKDTKEEEEEEGPLELGECISAIFILSFAILIINDTSLIFHCVFIVFDMEVDYSL